MAQEIKEWRVYIAPTTISEDYARKHKENYSIVTMAMTRKQAIETAKRYISVWELKGERILAIE